MSVKGEYLFFIKGLASHFFYILSITLSGEKRLSEKIFHGNEGLQVKILKRNSRYKEN